MAFAEPFSTPETADQRGDAFGPVVPVADDASRHWCACSG